MKLYYLICFSIILILSACTSHIHTPVDEAYGNYQTGASSQTIEYFKYNQQLPAYKHLPMAGFKHTQYKASVLSIPSISENGQKDNLIKAYYYASKIPGKKPLLIVLPLYGAYTYPPEEMTEEILQRSKGQINVLHLQGERYMIDWKSLEAAKTPEAFRHRLDDTVERMRVNVIDVRRLVDWANTESGIDAQRIGLLGFSHGAIVAGVVAIAEPRIYSTVLVMVVANPGEIIATCHLERTDTLRHAVMKKFGWNEQQYFDSLKGVFDPVNPVYYPGRVDARNVLIIESLYDECVPESARTALWDAMGRPERYRFKYGHRMSFMAMTPLGGYFMRRVINEFLHDKLLSPGNGNTSEVVTDTRLVTQ